LAACLGGKAVVRAEDLANRLEVSVRTVYRDIDALRSRGLPIDGQAGVGFMLRGDIHLPPIAFDHDELEALTLGLAYVEAVGDPDLAAAARAARGKADIVWRRDAALMKDRPIRASQRPERRSPTFGAAIRSALRTRRVLRFSYSDAQGRRTRREVRPLALIAFSEGWLLGGWCVGREDFRTFRLDRMAELCVAEVFQDDTGRDLSAYLRRPSRPYPPLVGVEPSTSGRELGAGPHR
jgi:predicted DNA-binding transcriptional regulator YafY